MTDKKANKNDLVEHNELDEADLDDVTGGCDDPRHRSSGGHGGSSSPVRAPKGGGTTLPGGGRDGDTTVASFEYSDVLEETV
jgi:hypothetical protein